MSQLPATNIPGDGMPYQRQNSEQSTPITSPSPINPSDHGALYTRLRNQVEFYFSPQNLARDTYLRNMLTAQHQEVPSPPPLQLMTPVAVITNFPKVRDICAAFGASFSNPAHVLLARACEGSTVVTVSPDGAWIGPASQLLPPLMAPTPRLGPPTPQSHFQQGPYPPSPHQHIMMMPANTVGDVQPMPYTGPQPVPVVQNVPLSGGSVSPSSNSLDSAPSQTKETVVLVPDMPAECNPILLMTVFTKDNIRPTSVSADANTNTWYLSFSSEEDAKAAIAASMDKMIAGAPIKAKLKSEAHSARVSVASGASLSSMSASQRQSQIPVPQMVQQPVPIPSGAVMYPPNAYPMPQPTPPPPLQHGMPPYPLGPHYNMAPLPMPGQHFPPYPQQMQPMYSYYPPQHGQPPFPMNHPPMMGRYGHGVPPPPPPPPRYPGPPYPYQHGPQHHMGEGHGQYHGPPQRQYSGEMRGPPNNFHEGGPKKPEHGGRKKKNRYQRKDSNGSDMEGGSNQQSHVSRDNASSPPNLGGRGRGRHGENFRRSTGSASPGFNRNHRGNNNNKSSRSTNHSNNEKQEGSKEIFSATDFPGLSGDMKSPGNEMKIFSGYADALLKKKDSDLKNDKESNATKETEVDSITRQTEAMEREILSDFHDLRIIGDEDNHGTERNSEINGDSEGHSSQNFDVVSKPKPFDHLPILPGMSGLGQSLSLDVEPMSDQSSGLNLASTDAQVQPPDNTELDNEADSSLPPTPSQHDQDKPASSGAWGSRRLFSDVIKDK